MKIVYLKFINPWIDPNGKMIIHQLNYVSINENTDLFESKLIIKKTSI